jgi:AraC family transcriptional regulator of arabinose operon
MSHENKSEKKVKEGFIGQKMIVLPPNVKKLVVKNDLINRLYLTAIGFYPHAVFHSRARKAGCSQYILLYCVAGSGNVVIEDKNFDLHANHYIILPKNIPHQYTSSQNNSWTIYWIHIKGDNADILFSRYIENAELPVFYAYDERRFREFELILKILENSFESRDLEIVNLMLQNFLSHLIYAKEINPSQMELDKITKSITFMKTNISENYSLQDLAAEQCLSVTHYSRLFRAKTGRSPNQYFNELKIQKACQYLYFSDLNIKEICVEIGFSDQYYFSRLFKKVMGIAPAIYKNQHKRS